MKERWILWVAQGFGVGRIPIAPGTWGSFVGLVWFLVLLSTRTWWIYVAGCVLGFALSVWFCGRAETILKQTDPGSVVLDEITAIPLCFAGWILIECLRNQQLPGVEPLFRSYRWLWLMVMVVLFRFFDIAKPWPVRQIQSLPGGWGITADDFLAALYVAVLSVVMPG